MEKRIEFAKVAREPVKALLEIERYLAGCGLERSLLDLVKLRVSQLNGCAYCIDMHTKDLRAAGESEQRLYLLTVWSEAPCYSDRERIALEWAEVVTDVAMSAVPDEAYQRARTEFSEKELVDLTFAVCNINSWNRLAISFRQEVGAYHPRTPAAEAARQAATATELH